MKATPRSSRDSAAGARRPRRRGRPRPDRRALEHLALLSARGGRAGPPAAPGSPAEPRSPPPCSLSASMREHLLEEERVPRGRGGDPCPRLGRKPAPAERSPISSADSSRVSGSSRIDVAFSLPPPQPGRPSRSSGRARQTISTGASRTQSARCSIRSSSVGSPQCTSSNTRTSGGLRASASTSLRTAQKTSSLAAPAVPEPIAALEPRGDDVRVRRSLRAAPGRRDRLGSLSSTISRTGQ